ncbi:MAG TPA: radical SAM protein, partial [Bacteroidales bacterium]|nr:radical SAM protein [Bacteroidales bacterium]
TFLFDKIVFGPVKSRRLGISLGINLLPLSKKYCNFDCVYCECGWSHLEPVHAQDIPGREEVAETLRDVLGEMKKRGEMPDVITFAGNGEPTMHPQFAGIAEDTVNIRNDFFPGCKISLLTNATLLQKEPIRKAIEQLDINILKLDTAINSTFEALNKPAAGITLERIIRNLCDYKGNKTVQTLFIRGKNSLSHIDNTTDDELNALILAYRKIKPDAIMVYTFERDTPSSELVRIPVHELEAIASLLEDEGFNVELTL